MKYRLVEKQRLGRNKQTLINRAFIEGGEYRKKFDKISDNADLNKIIYQLAKKMLNHRSGSLFEDMYWINPDTISIVAKETEDRKESNIIYSKRTKKVVKKHHNLITVHSHPYSYPPSLNDFNSNYINNYSMGIICCHDGKIFLYSAAQKINYFAYQSDIAKYRKRGYDEYDSQLLTLVEMRKKFDIYFREVL